MPAYTIPDFSQARVLVVGDVMLDRYWTGPIHRISPEAPVPVLSVHDEWECPGGAANVALNVAALGAQVSLLGVCGDDSAAYALERKLEEHHVHVCLIKDQAQKTIVKLRVLGHKQQVMRLDFDAQTVHGSLEALTKKFAELLPSVDVVVLSDYAKGTLRDAIQLIALANAHNIPVLVDPKTENLLAYQGAFLITPNLKEFQAIVGLCADEAELLQKGQALLDQVQLPALLVTRSEKGATLFQKDQPAFTLAAHQQEVYDVTGAGDTVIAVIAACLAAQLSLEDSVKLANLAAGISVRKLNAATVTVPELRREIWHNKATSNEKHIMSQEELFTAVADARAHGEVIVMTNGCFDILHPGHIAYLEEAKRLGDRLIVAVNDDASVRNQGKGADRPLNDLSTRMQVLAGLRSVDWVVPFSEHTPERLITAVLPDILVKGGDYQITEIAGHEAVLAHHGKVLILDFLPGFSTTGLIQKIQRAQ